MTQLPTPVIDSMKAFVEGQKSWSAWPLWYSVNARQLSRLLPRDLMRRLRENPSEVLPELLAERGVDCARPAAPSSERLHRPDEWVLYVCEDVHCLSTFSRLRTALGLPR